MEEEKEEEEIIAGMGLLQLELVRSDSIAFCMGG